MRTTDEVSAMLALKASGWVSKRSAAELGCSRNTVKRWLACRKGPSASPGACRSGGVAWRAVPPPCRQCRCGAAGTRSGAWDRGEPAHGRARGCPSAAGTARRGASDSALRNASGSAVADRLRGVSRRDRRPDGEGVLLCRHARLFPQAARPCLPGQTPGTLVRRHGVLLPGFRGRDRGGAARH